MIGGSVLGGALTRVAVGLPFLVAGLLNIASVVVALAFFAHLDRQRTVRAGVRAGELDVAT